MRDRATSRRRMDRHTPNGSIGALVMFASAAKPAQRVITIDLGVIEEAFDGGSQLVCTRHKSQMTIVEDVQLCARNERTH